MNLFINKKGQAALVDSIFFLTIVMAITGILLFFSINYGQQSQEQLESFYSSDFAADVLKIVTYINVARDGSSFSLSDIDSFFEIDYLLALIKEDYADESNNREITQRTKDALLNTFKSVLSPFQASMNYVFYIYDPQHDQPTYLFLFFYVHECLDEDDNPCSYTTSVVEGVGVVTESRTGDVRGNFYFCEPSAPNTFLERDLFPTLGRIDTAFGKITLPTTMDASGRPFEMRLSIWVSRDSEKISEISNGSGLNCELMN